MPILELISYVLTISGLFLMLLVVALKNIDSRINRTFIAFNILVLLYVVTAFASGFSRDLHTGILLSRFILLFADFIPLAFYLFTLAYTNYKPKSQFYYSLFIVTPILGILAFLPASITAVQLSPYGVVLKQTGPALLALILIFVVVFFRCFFILYTLRKVSSRTVKIQIDLMIYGLAAAIVINIVTQIVLPIFHIATWGAIVGIPSVLIFVGAVGYSIFRHSMFDIRGVLLRSLGYISTIVIVVIMYTAIIFAISDYIFPSLHLSIFQESYFVATAVLLTFTFRPVVKFIQKVTDKVFYRNLYDPQELINKIGRVLASEINLESLTEQVSDLLDQFIKTKQTDIVVLDKESVFYESAHVFTHVIHSFLLDMARLGNHTIVTDELHEGEYKAILRKYGIAFFSVLKTRNEKVGYLLLAEKNSGTNFGNVDISVINIVSDELAIAIQNSRAYTQIQQFNLTLQAEINKATTELRTANEHLKESDAVKDDFISLASHQLSTPLAVIDGYLSLATKGVYGHIDEAIEKPLSAALERAQVMKNLLADLLDISRMTAGKFILEIANADLSELVEKEVNQLKGMSAERNVTLTYHPPFHPLPLMQIDSKKTSQAVMNLITNSIAYAPHGKVDVYLEVIGPNAIVRVVDNGIGVPEEQKPKLFSKFFRADNAKNERPTGTGIGLYLVKRFIEDQGGSIIFESELNKGSTFGFSLPLTTNIVHARSPIELSRTK